MSPWTKEEDEILIRQVKEIGENDRWKEVALALPGRTNKACRKVVFFLLKWRSVVVAGFTEQHLFSSISSILGMAPTNL
jgi:hypothetical protein